MSNFNGLLGVSSGVSRTYSIQGRVHDGLKPISQCQPWEALPGCITSWIFICISRRNDSVAHCPKSWCPANHEQCQIPVWRREVFAQRNHKNLCFNKLTQTTIISDEHAWKSMENWHNSYRTPDHAWAKFADQCNVSNWKFWIYSLTLLLGSIHQLPERQSWIPTHKSKEQRWDKLVGREMGQTTALWNSTASAELPDLTRTAWYATTSKHNYCCKKNPQNYFKRVRKDGGRQGAT